MLKTKIIYFFIVIGTLLFTILFSFSNIYNSFIIANSVKYYYKNYKEKY